MCTLPMKPVLKTPPIRDFPASCESRTSRTHLKNGRPGGTRTPSIRFWRPALYQLELLAYFFLPLPGFLVHSVFVAEGTEFLVFHPIRMFSLIFGFAVIASFAIIASQCNYVARHILIYQTFQFTPRFRLRHRRPQCGRLRV